MKDEDPYVARSALESHLGRPLDAKELDTFASRVLANETNGETDALLGAIILRHGETNKGAVKTVLETLLSRAPEGSETASNLERALQSLSS